MKTSFAVLGVIFLIVLAVGGIGFGLLALNGSPLDVIVSWLVSSRGNALESKTYADVTIPAIAGTRSENELVGRISGDDQGQSIAALQQQQAQPQ